jgi:phosphoglycolate phosphatase
MAAYKAIILDFDGPMCNVFAGYPASDVAAAVHTEFGLDTGSDDPLSYLAVPELAPVIDQVHEFITRHETQAVESAVETKGLRTLLETPLAVAVASNNSTEAIERWLELNGLTTRIQHVEGRNPRAMKPHPTALLNCASKLGLQVNDCLFIGDSRTDAEAAAAAEMPFYGYANKPAKLAIFTSIAVDHTIDMGTIADYLHRESRPSSSA